MKIPTEKKQALRDAIDQLGEVTYDSSISSDSDIDSQIKNRACYLNDMARIRRLQNARSDIFDEYAKAFDMTDIEIPQVPAMPVTLLSVQLDNEAEALLKEANEKEGQFFDIFFPQKDDSNNDISE